MGSGEKLYAVFAILFVIALTALLVLVPESRQLKILLPVSLVGLLINIVFMFLVLRDIFLREQLSFGQKVFWVILILVFWPAVLVYLPLFGFRPRKTIDASTSHAS